MKAGIWTIDVLYGGPVLSARGKGFVVFWDWETHQHLDKFSDGLKKSALLKKSDISNKNLIV